MSCSIFEGTNGISMNTKCMSKAPDINLIGADEHVFDRARHWADWSR